MAYEVKGVVARSKGAPVPMILNSIRERLLTLPGSTLVRTGHGDSTTIEQKVANVP